MISDNFTDLNKLRLKIDIEGFNSELLYWGYFDGSEWWRNYMHVHSFFEVCYVLKGSGNFTINSTSYPVKEKDLFIAKPGEKHEIISDHSDPMAIFFWGYTLVNSNTDKHTNIAELLTAFQETKVNVCTNQTYCGNILDALVRETNLKEVGYPFIAEGLVKQLIIEIARASTHGVASKIEEAAGSYQQTVVNTIKRYLNDNYSEPLKLKQIAAQVHMSERHMSRIFKSVTGLRIKQYFTDIKIKIARQLLLNTSKSVFEVAYETGFQDTRHFSTVFKKHVGASPTEFRLKGGTEFL